MEVLRENPMTEGHMYEGDLLSAPLARNPSVWDEFPDLGRELRVRHCHVGCPDGMIFGLIMLGGIVRGQCVAVVQGTPVPGRGDLPLCVAVLPFPA
ncbi:MAG TPA: contact-dependent growth inhibition system immunity protein [Streptomyces sp.]|uniref:contact-dependent growth inhibition system immunity protein n=1 Tax=Streptomyces sp. TaxID=1931 RepID=UPI002C35D3F6|nr:contact-dependent growth inhibition system immunity protein [Streptomyces sp.]HWU05610.1 contact-dependent growth inhibition system immunity protein [Streptomyces sp.]